MPDNQRSRTIRAPQTAARDPTSEVVRRMKRYTAAFGRRFKVVPVLLLAIGAAGVASGEMVLPAIDPRTIPTVGTQEFAVRYHADESGGPITRAELWYTRDEGKTWSQVSDIERKSALADAMMQRELTFRAEEDGLYGFYIILHNAAGPSALPPEPGTRPMQWVRVVTSAPLVSITAVRPDERFDRNRQVVIRWNVIGDHLPERPVTVQYRSEQTGSYRSLAELQQPTGAFCWTVPDGIHGRVAIKVVATDLAGHRGSAVYDQLRIDEITTNDRAVVTADRTLETNHSAFQKSKSGETGPHPPTVTWLHGEPDAAPATLDDVAARQAQARYEQGTWHRLRGEYDLAIARYRETVEIDPQLHAARHDLAAVLLLLGRIEQAEQELGRILSVEPDHRASLKTLALLHARRKEFRSASETLQKLLLVDPRNPEAWLYFGDMALFTGDRPAALAAWQKVGELEGAGDELRQRARTRLEMYRGNSGEWTAEPDRSK